MKLSITLVLIGLLGSVQAQNTSINEQTSLEQQLSLPTGKTDWVDPVKAVAEGCHYLLYPTPSRGEGTEGSCMVYLPPQYNDRPAERYPVIYYLHGGACSSVAGAVVDWDEEPLTRALECTFGDVNNPYARIYFDAWHPRVFACQHARHIVAGGMKIRLFVGDKDRLYEENGHRMTERFDALLTALQIPHTFTVVPGANHNPAEIFADDVNPYDTSFWDAAWKE